MSFTESDKNRFYQVNPFDTLTTVGRFELHGSLLRKVQLSLFDTGDLFVFRSNAKDGHAEKQFLNEVQRTYVIPPSNIPPPEEASLTLFIKITYSPCSDCREGLKGFFTSLPQPTSSRLDLRIQFANLYHQDNNSTEKEIEMLANWLLSFEKENINVRLLPLRVTEDPEFVNPRPLKVTNENFTERQRKDDLVSQHVEEIYKKLEQLRDQQLSQAMEKLSLEARNKERASKLKMQGNEACRNGNLQLAIEFYTESIQFDPENHILYSNRAIAYKKSKRFQQALSDAEKSIQLKPDWAKGYYLKGTALTQQKKYPEAAEAYKHGLRYEPKNHELKSALSDVETKLVSRRMASGIFGAEHPPPKPPTKAEVQKEHTRKAMEKLHSDGKLRSLMKTGNALASVPQSVKRALANAGSTKGANSEEELPTGTYVIHDEKVSFPGGEVRKLSLHVRFEFVRETVTKSGKVTKITRYYNLIMEWK